MFHITNDVRKNENYALKTAYRGFEKKNRGLVSPYPCDVLTARLFLIRIAIIERMQCTHYVLVIQYYFLISSNMVSGDK